MGGTFAALWGGSIALSFVMEPSFGSKGERGILTILSIYIII